MPARIDLGRLLPLLVLVTAATARADERPASQAAAHVKLGDAYASHGAYDKAIDEYEAAAKLEPRPALLFKEAVAYEKMRDLAHALALYKQFTATELEGGMADEARNKIALLTVNLRREHEIWAQRDDDGDGIRNGDDKCPNEPEDKDGYQDADGCPDPDNDGDGIPDALDKCPNDAEDKDGFQDADGCPDLDNDGDGIPDALDKCPNEPEDKDGFQDDDGCPDPDNDGDGVPDLVDRCPNVAGPYDGCPAEKVWRAGHPTLRTAGLVTLGMGGAALIASGIFALQARSASQDVSGANGEWSTALDQRVADGQTADTRFKVLAVTGGAAVAAGLALYLIGTNVGGSYELVPPSGLTVGPMVPDRGGGGVTLAGRF